MEMRKNCFLQHLFLDKIIVSANLFNLISDRSAFDQNLKKYFFRDLNCINLKQEYSNDMLILFYNWYKGMVCERGGDTEYKFALL